MSTNRRNETGEQSTNDVNAAAGAAADPAEPDEPPQLASTLVRYEGKADRVTVYPPGVSSVERMSTWITVDADDCVVPAERR